MRQLLFFLLGILSIIIVHTLYKNYVLGGGVKKEVLKTIPSQISPKFVQNDSMNTNKDYNIENQIEIKTINERIQSINQRFDDLYIFGGIIITLVLAIIVSVYIRAESEVDKHFKDNFEKYKNQIIKNSIEAEKIISEIKVKAVLLEELKRNISRPQNVDRGAEVEQPSN